MEGAKDRVIYIYIYMYATHLLCRLVYTEMFITCGQNIFFLFWKYGEEI